jgi:nicotinate-nucleotide pyrophosphorylase (carboxylating)
MSEGCSKLADRAPGAPPPLAYISAQVRVALDEDIGSGDLTSALISDAAVSSASITCRDSAVLCGAPWLEEVFRQLDLAIAIHWDAADAQRLIPGQVICTLRGHTRALLTGERTALNFLQTLSATATSARRYADAVAGTGVRILDTRKTIPGMRLAQKYAVRCGGCFNHRFGLYDAILIKENHIHAAGSISAAVGTARRLSPEAEIEVEVESLSELREALASGAQRILLDNFSLQTLRKAVRISNGRCRLEASGGVDLDTVREIAETGVDDISIGGLTKDIQAVDLSLRFAEAG